MGRPWTARASVEASHATQRQINQVRQLSFEFLPKVTTAEHWSDSLRMAVGMPLEIPKGMQTTMRQLQANTKAQLQLNCDCSIGFPMVFGDFLGMRKDRCLSYEGLVQREDPEMCKEKPLKTRPHEELTQRLENKLFDHFIQKQVHPLTSLVERVFEEISKPMYSSLSECTSRCKLAKHSLRNYTNRCTRLNQRLIRSHNQSFWMFVLLQRSFPLAWA